MGSGCPSLYLPQLLLSVSIEACRQIKQQHPELPILVLTSHSQKPLISRLIEASAQGYCLKGIAAEALILAIRSVAAGASWWDPTATTEIRLVFQGNQPDSGSNAAETLELLTRHEQEILTLVADGKSNQEIAEILYIAPGTVRVHVHARIMAIQKQLIAADLVGSVEIVNQTRNN